MNLDIRLPIGMLLSIYAVILIALGAISPQISVGINVNFVWGFVLLAVGLIMLLLVVRAVKKTKPQA